MRPILNKFRRDVIHPSHWAKICKCKEKCEEAISFTTHKDGMILCANEARHFMYELIRTMDEGQAYTTWSKDDEKFIIDLVKKRGGMVKGINREIAEACGKTYEKAKSKTARMKKAGLI